MTRHRLTASALAIATLLAAAGHSIASPNVTEIELGQSGIAHYTMVQQVTGPNAPRS